jgi:cell division protein FtsA
MSRESILVGIDIGSFSVKTIITQNTGGEMPRVIGVGTAASFGVRRGSISDVEEVAKAMAESVEKAERIAGIKVKRAAISIGGSGISFQEAKGVVAVGRADGEVTGNDVQRVIGEVQNASLPMNKEIIHIVPRSYRLDDQEGIKDPVGMKGVRLEVDALLIEGSSVQMKNLIKCSELADVEVDDVVLEPLAASQAVLGKKQKELGVVLVDIGGQTTSIIVFEEGELIHTAVIPVGAAHITNDIAIGLRTTVDVAERVKLEFGCALPTEVNKKEEIDLAKIDSQEEGLVSRFHVVEIIEARLEEIFKMVNKELQSVKRAGLLPAGAVLAGGGAKIPFITDLAKRTLSLPCQVGYPTSLGGMMNEIDDPIFSTCVGLVLWLADQRESRHDFTGVKIFDNISRSAEFMIDRLKRWLGKFLP